MSSAATVPPGRRHRARHCARRRALAIGIGAAVGVAGYAGIATAGVAAGVAVRSSDHPRAELRLVEAPGCTASSADAPAPGNGGDADQVVAVLVRPTALLEVDGRGRVVAAWTNTGCAPRRTDDLYVRVPDGSITPADQRLAQRRWSGDFREPGVLVPQGPPGRR